MFASFFLQLMLVSFDRGTANKELSCSSLDDYHFKSKFNFSHFVYASIQVMARVYEHGHGYPSWTTNQYIMAF